MLNLCAFTHTRVCVRVPVKIPRDRRDWKALTCPNTIIKSQKSSLWKSNGDLPEKNTKMRGWLSCVDLLSELESKYNSAPYGQNAVYAPQYAQYVLLFIFGRWQKHNPDSISSFRAVWLVSFLAFWRQSLLKSRQILSYIIIVY